MILWGLDTTSPKTKQHDDQGCPLLLRLCTAVKTTLTPRPHRQLPHHPCNQGERAGGREGAGVQKKRKKQKSWSSARDLIESISWKKYEWNMRVMRYSYSHYQFFENISSGCVAGFQVCFPRTCRNQPSPPSTSAATKSAKSWGKFNLQELLHNCKVLNSLFFFFNFLKDIDIMWIRRMKMLD